jgi:hypothetical protein
MDKKQSIIDEKSKHKIKSITELPYEKLVAAVNAEPIVWSGTDQRGEYQAELACSWDDRKKGSIRVTCIKDAIKIPIWKFFSTVIYDQVVYPSDEKNKTKGC